MVTAPVPFVDLERMLFTPDTRARADSMRDVATDSIVRAELPYMLNDTVIEGRFWEGALLTGNSGNSAHPTMESAMNTTIMENDLEDNVMIFKVKQVPELYWLLPNALYSTISVNGSPSVKS